MFQTGIYFKPVFISNVRYNISSCLVIVSLTDFKFCFFKSNQLAVGQIDNWSNANY